MTFKGKETTQKQIFDALRKEFNDNERKYGLGYKDLDIAKLRKYVGFAVEITYNAKTKMYSINERTEVLEFAQRIIESHSDCEPTQNDCAPVETVQSVETVQTVQTVQTVEFDASIVLNYAPF
jgi:hypothetical protein